MGALTVMQTWALVSRTDDELSCLHFFAPAWFWMIRVGLSVSSLTFWQTSIVKLSVENQSESSNATKQRATA